MTLRLRKTNPEPAGARQAIPRHPPTAGISPGKKSPLPDVFRAPVSHEGRRAQTTGPTSAAGGRADQLAACTRGCGEEFPMSKSKSKSFRPAVESLGDRVVLSATLSSTFLGGTTPILIGGTTP